MESSISTKQDSPPRIVAIGVSLFAASFLVGVPRTILLVIAKPLSGLLVVAIFVPLMLWICLKLYRGANWLRLLSALIIGLGIICLPWQIDRVGSNLWEQIVYVVQCALQGVGCAILFSREANKWYSKRPAAEQFIQPDRRGRASQKQATQAGVGLIQALGANAKVIGNRATRAVSSWQFHSLGSVKLVIRRLAPRISQVRQQLWPVAVIIWRASSPNYSFNPTAEVGLNS